MPLEYLRDPEAIYAQSFAVIRAEADMSKIPASARGVAERIDQEQLAQRDLSTCDCWLPAECNS